MFCSFLQCYMYAAWLMLYFSALSFLLHTGFWFGPLGWWQYISHCYILGVQNDTNGINHMHNITVCLFQGDVFELIMMPTYARGWPLFSIRLKITGFNRQVTILEHEQKANDNDLPYKLPSDLDKAVQQSCYFAYERSLYKWKKKVLIHNHSTLDRILILVY